MVMAGASAAVEVASTVVPERVRRLEPWTVLALAAHGAAVGAVSSTPPTLVVAVLVLGALGLVGLAGWQSVRAATVRFATVLALAFVLMAQRADGSGYFLLWLFVLVSVYPLVLSDRGGLVVAGVVPLAYLGLLPLDAADGPLPVALVRAVSLLLIGLVVRAAVMEFRDVGVARSNAVAMLDTMGDNAPVGLAYWGLDLRVAGVNPVFAMMCGAQPGDLVGTAVEDLMLPAADLAHHCQRIRDGLLSTVRREVHSGGRWWTLDLFAVPGRQGLIGFGAVAVDVTDQRESVRALAHSATHDPLTGLPNRDLFGDRLQVAVARASRRQEQIAVMFCDLDRFKVVNDSLGHSVGDEILRTASARLASAVRDGDTVARLGGDEFAVLCTEVPDREVALAVAERVRAAVQQPMRVGDRELAVTVSVGVTVGVPDPGDASQLLADADVAMYQAKDAGRDRVRVFDQTLREDMRQRFEFHADLRAAVERNAIDVAYQPIVELGSGRVVAVEALARWTNRTTRVSPAVFIPMAEDLGLIDALSRQVSARAAADLAAWRSSGRAGLTGMVVALNISPQQLADGSCGAQLAELIERTGLPPAAIQVEVTESAVMRDVRSSIASLEQLRGLGVSIALDDFGTGYSSLAILRDLPFDVIKIDRSFTARLPDDSPMVSFVVELARATGATTVVEGVETPAQLALVTGLGCDRAQGYLLGRPGPAEDVVTLATQRA